MLIIWALMVWSIIIKAIALWKSARRGQTAWFVILVIFQTVGILEIIYLAAFQKHQRVRRKVNKKIKSVKKSKEK
ncbi:hypothetical protein HN592_01400 [Candidatus Woesearchaeota archaeon]|nr:hypothetical protein [Candidatus Woesearchaeota archaeon]MBT4368666.1 hypothetical protein [Candidatus Woesearchaeota archaeon]MBT4712221.1 hypothetical protein [Candidatus Woesearchaeota archaeon]MBT6638947.1 hypothetical protein [Candidatus Woesearchaeota archaeon]MBT7134151.1 hypothetical protein [Candidatus Woesearchaeota archaeon]